MVAVCFFETLVSTCIVTTQNTDVGLKSVIVLFFPASCCLLFLVSAVSKQLLCILQYISCGILNGRLAISKHVICFGEAGGRKLYGNMYITSVKMLCRKISYHYVVIVRWLRIRSVHVLLLWL
jgi:hypothetical protein